MDEFVDASRKVVAASTGSDALRALDWWDMLAALDDPDARAAVLALFRAQGRELGDTCALGALVAAPYVADRADGTVAAALAHHSVRRGPVLLLVGDPTVDHVLIDRPGRGAALVPTGALELRRADIPGRLTVHEVVIDPAGLAPTIDEATAVAARARGRALGRLGAAFEILGAAEGALALAVAHANGRVQFGQPIGTFQAVRHLLAWAVADCAAVESLATVVADLDTAAPPRLDEIVKALAGRNGRRACERALQVLGGIGFTAELDHHHFHSRVLTLDSLLGSSTELTAGLGAWIRTERPDPGIARAVLLGMA